jgi:rhodanese-related sulfurtransferase
MRTKLIAATVAAACLFTAGQAIAEISPETVAGAVTVDAHEAKTLFDQGVAFVDTRNGADWEAGRIPGSIHLNSRSVLSEETLAEAVARDERVVIYCNGWSCMRSSDASERAVSWGFTNVYYFRDGYPAWETVDYPIE